MHLFFRQVFTDVGNQFDLHKLVWIACAIAFLAFSAFSVLSCKAAFDAIAFATASGAIMTAGSGLATLQTRFGGPRGLQAPVEAA